MSLGDDSATADTLIPLSRLPFSRTVLEDFGSSFKCTPHYVHRRGRMPDYLRHPGTEVQSVESANRTTTSRPIKDNQETAKPLKPTTADKTLAQKPFVQPVSSKDPAEKVRPMREERGSAAKKQAQSVKQVPSAPDRQARLEDHADVKALVRLVKKELNMLAANPTSNPKHDETRTKKLGWQLRLLQKQDQALGKLSKRDQRPGLVDLLRRRVSKPFPFAVPVPVELTHVDGRLRDSDIAQIRDAFDLQTFQGVGECLQWVKSQAQQLMTSPMHWQPKQQYGPKAPEFLLGVARLWHELCCEQYKHTPCLPPGVMLGMKDIEDDSEQASPSYSPRTPTPSELAQDPNDSYLNVDSTYPDMEPELPDNWEELMVEWEKLDRKSAMSGGVGDALRNAGSTGMEEDAGVERESQTFESSKPEGRVPGSARVPASVSGPDGVSAKASLAVEGGGADEDSDLEEGEIRE